MTARRRSAGQLTASLRAPEGRGHTALVTGASAGIGRSFAELLASVGYDLVLVARRRERLEELGARLSSAHGVRADVIPADLADPEACRNIKAELDRLGITVDFLVNNAGCTVLGKYCDVPWQQQEAFVRVIGLSVLELTRYLLPGMVEQGWGRIVNVTSMAGYLAGSPGQTLYSPVKAMVHKFSEGVAEEYEEQGIICTVAPPGATDTELFEATGPSAAEYVRSSRMVQGGRGRPRACARRDDDAGGLRPSCLPGMHARPSGRRPGTSQQDLGVRPDPCAGSRPVRDEQVHGQSRTPSGVMERAHRRFRRRRVYVVRHRGSASADA